MSPDPVADTKVKRVERRVKTGKYPCCVNSPKESDLLKSPVCRSLVRSGVCGVSYADIEALAMSLQRVLIGTA